MKKAFRKLGLAALVAAALTQAPSASAQAMIGFDPTGMGNYTAYAAVWLNDTDSGLALGFTPVEGSTLEFISQTNVQAMAPGSLAVNVALQGVPGVIPPQYEITKVLRLRETVTSFMALPGGASVATFGMADQTGIDVDGNAANGDQQLAIYFDADLTDGSVSVPGDGANTVRCYGAGPTSADCADDGVLILSAHAVANFSTFAASSPTVGAGGFNVVFEIDFVNEDYLDVDTFNVIRERFTGSTIVPSVHQPDVVWTGDDAQSGILFTVNSSQTWLAPEPGSLALMSLALLGLGAWRRRGLARA